MVTTTNKGLAEPASGDLNWNFPLNTNFEIIDAALGGRATIDVTSVTSTQTLTAEQYQCLILNFTGTLDVDLIYQVPSGVGGQWIVTSSVTGAHTITIRNAPGGGATAIIPVSVTGGVTVYSDGTNVYLTGGGGANLYKKLVFTASGTWTKPAGASLVLVRCWGAGGGGASGQLGASATLKAGGTGGGGGAFYEKYFDADALPSTVTVTIGAGGAGGIGNFVAGSAGGQSSFGSLIVCSGGSNGTTSAAGGAAQGASGSVGSTNVVSLAAGSASGAYYGGAGSEGGSSGGSSAFGGGGGGSGGGESSANVLNTPWPGGVTNAASSGTLGGGGANGTSNASAPTAGSAGTALGMGGGGGGSAQSAAKAGSGGNGGLAAGGGGGGSNRTGLLSGDGGAGGAGYVEVYTW